ncbi:hypothetical protein [Leifsonia poae]|uniref:hypothetical protein n=1 Tax=Leifsonia poae TaxID=110933 RepID=UPI0027E142A0|nr:hypothetical protein [Leifsonia poae]
MAGGCRRRAPRRRRHRRRHALSDAGAGDAATWLPPNKAYRCEYAARQVTVKAAYGLWVTAAEHDALQRILTGCAAGAAGLGGAG